MTNDRWQHWQLEKREANSAIPVVHTIAKTQGLRIMVGLVRDRVCGRVRVSNVRGF